MVLDESFGCRGDSQFFLFSAGWADPERQIAMAYLTGRLVSRSAGARHMSNVSDAVLSAFG